HKNICKKQEKIFSKTNAVELNDIYFRYDKNGKDILKNLSLKIPENCFFSILGGNGAGKQPY
ncbi:MAG: ABC transporter ATP-binding protein, partial [Ruminococcus sp.]|nr:ABC transporter ATP-binding protein [Candidatus Copronaster equi]